MNKLCGVWILSWRCQTWGKHWVVYKTHPLLPKPIRCSSPGSCTWPGNISGHIMKGPSGRPSLDGGTHTVYWNLRSATCLSFPFFPWGQVSGSNRLKTEKNGTVTRGYLSLQRAAAAVAEAQQQQQQQRSADPAPAVGTAGTGRSLSYGGSNRLKTE